MKRETCCECGKKKEPRAAVTKLTDGEILWICFACWTAFDYAAFAKGPDEHP